MLMRYCELPKGSEDWTFDTWKPSPGLKEAYDAALQLAGGDGSLEWLTLASKTNRGKTHLAVAVVRTWIARGVPAKFIFVPDLLDWLKEAYEHKDEPGALSFSARMHVLQTTPLLVLDDLGTEKPTAWATERLDTIINHRYANHLPLMVTTNKPIDNLPGDDEGRIGSRLRRYIPGKVVTIVAPEYHLKSSR